MKIYEQNEIDELANILKNDRVIAVPTDTVYGICARIDSVNAYEKLKDIKKRPNNKNFPLMCKDEEEIKSIAIVNKQAEKLISAFMPGPVTFILNKKPEVMEYINNAGGKISSEMAVRMAPTNTLRELIAKVGSPIFMTSANRSGNQICKNLEEIEKECPNLDGIMKGNVSFGQSSTIIDCTTDTIKIQREGPITKEQILEVLRQ